MFLIEMFKIYFFKSRWTDSRYSIDKAFLFETQNSFNGMEQTSLMNGAGPPQPNNFYYHHMMPSQAGLLPPLGPGGGGISQAPPVHNPFAQQQQQQHAASRSLPHQMQQAPQPQQQMQWINQSPTMNSSRHDFQGITEYNLGKFGL